MPRKKTNKTAKPVEMKPEQLEKALLEKFCDSPLPLIPKYYQKFQTLLQEAYMEANSKGEYFAFLLLISSNLNILTEAEINRLRETVAQPREGQEE